MSSQDLKTTKYGDQISPALIGAQISHVDDDSPADHAGIKPDMVILEVDGITMHDIIDWLWLTDGDETELTLNDGQMIIMTRDFGEPWGINFADPLFTKIMTCRNNCMFCFMTMLPKGMRSPLYLRDDDYRLSFLQGNFVTLTNLSDEDVDRIIEQRISPLHVSLHAVTSDVRHRLMGKNHARGIEVLEDLLDSGIDVHAQIVLVPGINDGEELDATLKWIEDRPNILSAGIVPYGYTKYAKLQKSFSPGESRAVIEQLRPYQERAWETFGETRFQLADEWYLKAELSIPAADYYGDFPQFEDGIGMLRAFMDEWQGCAEDVFGCCVDSRRSDSGRGVCDSDREVCENDKEIEVDRGDCENGEDACNIYLVTGEAFAPTLTKLTEQLPVEVIPIKNNFFGGNVTVAGLLTAKDIIEQLLILHIPKNAIVAVPDVIFNADALTLDNLSINEMAKSLDLKVIMVPCSAQGVTQILRDYIK